MFRGCRAEVFNKPGGGSMSAKLALVGGSSSGIGKAIAEGLLKKGTDVILTGRNKKRLSDCREELETRYAGSKVFAWASDYSSQRSGKELITLVQRKTKSPDVLILNSGGPAFGTFDDVGFEEWDRSYQQQFRSSLMLLKAFLPSM